jgi:carbon dioxide concentrating mechanism protein CcmN
MHLPLLQPAFDSHVQVYGDVWIHDSAAIAPGVLLQADPGCRILIGIGACIGMGCILHASQGTLEVAAGVILGAGVLIVGPCTIEANACVGAATTILNSSVQQGDVIPPGSLVGDMSRTVQPSSTGASDAPDPWTDMSKSAVPSSNGASAQPTAVEPPTPPAQPEPEPTVSSNPISGQIRLNQLLVTLMPHRQLSAQVPPLNPALDED